MQMHNALYVHRHTTQVAQKTLQAAAKKMKAAPGAPTKKKRKRPACEGESDSDDDEGIEITPPEEEAPLRPLAPLSRHHNYHCRYDGGGKPSWNTRVHNHRT
jgi:hypothetical protein